ncbi:hypothetical protein EW146_g7945, partial [Bondarzewia mesenterica]
MPPAKRQKLSKDATNPLIEEDAERRNVAPSDDGNGVVEASGSEPSGSDSEDVSADTEDDIADVKRSKSKKTLKRKYRATDASNFGATLQSLLSTDTPSTLPLSLKPSVARKRNDEKLELKAKKVLKIEKREKEDKGRIQDVIGGWGGESERALRKVAQRGVVKLFNAIQQWQASAAVAVQETKAVRGSGKPTLPAPSFDKSKSNKGKNKDNPLGRGKETAMDKDDFLDMIRTQPFYQSSKTPIAKDEWERRLEEVQVTKQDLNRLVMDYLVIEGYKSAAEEFSEEAGVTTPVDFDSIESRMNIREALQRGDVQDAITRVNDLNPEILDTNPALYFRLQQQKLIEYIRQGDVAAALRFAQEELAPRGEESPEFLSELERTMALLAFESSPAVPSAISDLLSPAQRMKTAGEVNAAILESLSQGKEAKLVALLKLLCWGESMLDERAEFPKRGRANVLLSIFPPSPSRPAQFVSRDLSLPLPAVSCVQSTAMSDDTRSLAPRTRKPPHRPILIVANPGPDSDSGEDNDRASNSYANYQQQLHNHPYNQHLSPIHTSPPDKAIPTSSSYHEPGPLSTANLPSHARHHPASRSNPTLSSPSGTSSPPPSTPGQSAPPVDFSGDGGPRHDFPMTTSYSTEALQQQQTPQCIPRPNFFGKIKSQMAHHPFAHNRRLSSSSRPATSPTTSETFTTRFANDSRSSPLEKVLIFVTGDSDQYYTVDISGFRDGAFIKELIFSKLRISDEEQSQYSVYRTKIGAYAIGDALRDDQLYELCRDEGDAVCSLKFLVASSSAVVHEASQSSPVTSPTVSTVPPPVILPTSSSPYPLRHKRRSQSRHGSISSASERIPPELTNGYDPSVSDDLDGMEDSQRSTLRPPPRQALASPTQNPAPPSPNSRRPGGPIRPASPPQIPASSPLPPPTPERSGPSHVDFSSRRGERGRPEFLQTIPLPPQSPDRSRTPFDEESSGSQLHVLVNHARSGSDAAAEREKELQASESRVENAGKQWQQQAYRTGDRQEKPRRKGPLGRDQTKTTREPSWVVLDRSSPLQESPRAPRRDRDYKGSPRYAQNVPPFVGRSPLPHVPRQPPPAPPGGSGSDSRSSGRPAGQVVPSNWAVTWKGPGRTDQPSAAPMPRFNLKGAKSVDGMREKFKIPVTLMPGAPGAVSRRTQPPVPSLPMAPSTSISSLRDVAANTHSAFTSGESLFSPRRDPSHATSPENARSYTALQPGVYSSPTAHRTVRPLPTQMGGGLQSNSEAPGPLYGPSPPRTQLPVNSPPQPSSNNTGPNPLSPQQDLYPRPRSAVGEEAAPPPPYRPQRTVDASVFAEPLLETDPVRSPQSHVPMYPFVSHPGRQLPSTFPRDENVSGSRAPPSYSNRMPAGPFIDRPPDSYGNLNDASTMHSNRTPPRSPASPRSPRVDLPPRERFGPRPDLSLANSDSLRSPEVRSPDATVLQADRTWMRNVQEMLESQTVPSDTTLMPTLKPKTET